MNAFNNVETSTEETWNQLKTALLDTTNETCGETKKQHYKRETWWWNDEVNSAIAEKRRCWKGWKQGGGKEQYLQAKRTVYTAKKTAEEKKFSDLKPGMDNIFKRLLNEEFSWNPEDLTADADPVVGPPIHIDVEMVVKAITKMKTGKVAGPSGIVAEMLKASGDTGARLVADLANDIVRNGAIPSDWEDSFIINMVMLWREVTNRDLKLLVMKGMERVIEKIIRERISIDDMQFGFMPGRGTTDAIFIRRQLQEKHLAKNKKLYFAFVDLEKSSGGPCENLA